MLVMLPCRLLKRHITTTTALLSFPTSVESLLSYDTTSLVFRIVLLLYPTTDSIWRLLYL